MNVKVSFGDYHQILGIRQRLHLHAQHYHLLLTEQLGLKKKLIQVILRKVADWCCLFQFLIEAEEETGSANLAQLLRRKRKLLAADLAVSTDGGQISATQGGIPISMRGRVSFDLEAVTASHDAHSGEH